jgi:hypothetical protein
MVSIAAVALLVVAADPWPSNTQEGDVTVWTSPLLIGAGVSAGGYAAPLGVGWALSDRMELRGQIIVFQRPSEFLPQERVDGVFATTELAYRFWVRKPWAFVVAPKAVYGMVSETPAGATFANGKRGWMFNLGGDLGLELAWEHLYAGVYAGGATGFCQGCIDALLIPPTVSADPTISNSNTWALTTVVNLEVLRLGYRF